MAKPLTKAVQKSTLDALQRNGWNRAAAAKELGVSPSTVKSRVDSFKAKGVKVEDASPVKTAASDSNEKVLKTRLVEAEKAQRAFQKVLLEKNVPLKPKSRRAEKEDRIFVVLPDIHGSEADEGALAAVYGDLTRLKPDAIIQLGDLSECAGFSSKFGAQTVKDMHYSYALDIKASAAILDELQKHTQEIHILEGNHDHHLERWAAGVALGSAQDAELIRRQLCPEELLNFNARGIQYYRRHEMHCGLTARGVLKIGKLHFTHGIMGGGSSPQQVLNSYGVSMFFGHTHRQQMAIVPNMTGPIGAWNPGCLSKLQPRWRHGDFTKFSHGYGVVHMARSGSFQAELISISNGVSLLRNP